MINKEEKIKDEIIETARKLFQKYGLAKTTMEDIAKALGKGKSTLYYYYKSKNDIFADVIGKESKEVTAAAKIAVDRAQSASDKILSYFNSTTETITKKINLYNLVSGELSATLGTSIDLIVKLKKQTDATEISFVRNILLDGCTTGEFSPFVKHNCDLIAYGLVSSFRSIVIGLLTSDNIHSWTEQYEILSQIILKGLKT